MKQYPENKPVKPFILDGQPEVAYQRRRMPADWRTPEANLALSLWTANGPPRIKGMVCMYDLLRQPSVRTLKIKSLCPTHLLVVLNRLIKNKPA